MSSGAPLGPLATRALSYFHEPVLIAPWAKAQAKSLGRPFKLTPDQQHEARTMLANDRSVCDVAKVFNVNPSTSRLPG